MNSLESLLDFAKRYVPFHRRRAPEQHCDLSQWPLMSQFDLTEFSLDTSDDLLSHIPSQEGGQIIASGGTTRRPKYVYYSHSEMATLVRNIANHLAMNGIKPNDRVVNYFSAGDMWSGFLVADRALALLPVTIIPLGFSPNLERAIEILEHFKPNAIIGIPSMILDLARYCARRNPQIRMQKVYFGGESMTSSAMELLKSIWGCEIIRSASYASTDVGSIGWQCPHCGIGEHYPFDDIVVEIISGEIVVTSLNRRAMPIIRYRTGDGGKWVSAPCDCGGGSPLFKLLSRIDNTIIIWGCWILYDEIEMAFRNLKVNYTALQIQAYTKDQEQYLLVQYESPSPSGQSLQSQLRAASYESCRDAQESMSREMFEQYIDFEPVPLGSLERNKRTGKITPIIDARRTD